MKIAEETLAPSFGRSAARHSVGWLMAANLVGLWLSVSVLWPRLGDALAPLTYGRWMPLHLDWQLYGWCSLPLVGALLAWCLDRRRSYADQHARAALTAWSLALALGGVAWLSGLTSGKVFLDWYGWTRPLLPLAMQLLWIFLALHTVWRWAGLSSVQRVERVVWLAGLVVVPAAVYWFSGRDVYHPVNPDSGGATGAAILGSTLGIITIYLMLPRFLGIAPQRRLAPFVAALVVGWVVFAFMKRGNVSHHVAEQVAAMGVLLLWIPLLPLFWRAHDWAEAAQPWLTAATLWWVVLVATGWLTFLPGVSEQWKFTNAMVGHSHLAMAGFVTSVNGMIVVTLAGRPAPRGVFAAWQGGCVLYIISMYVLGWRETQNVADLYRSEQWTDALLACRLLGGLAMTAASVRWFGTFLRR